MLRENRILKIWYVSAYDAPCGHSSRTYDYAAILARKGHQVTMFCSSYDHFTHQERLSKDERWREEQFGKVKVIWLKTFPYKGNGLSRMLNMLSNARMAYRVGSFMKEKPDIITGPSGPLFTALAAWFLSKRKHCHFCFEVRDIWPQTLVDLGLVSRFNPLVFLFS